MNRQNSFAKIFPKNVFPRSHPRSRRTLKFGTLQLNIFAKTNKFVKPYGLLSKTNGRKSRDTVPLSSDRGDLPGVALHHLVRCLEAGGGDVSDGEALVVGFVGA